MVTFASRRHAPLRKDAVGKRREARNLRALAECHIKRAALLEKEADRLDELADPLRAAAIEEVLRDAGVIR